MLVTLHSALDSPLVHSSSVLAVECRHIHISLFLSLGVSALCLRFVSLGVHIERFADRQNGFTSQIGTLAMSLQLLLEETCDVKKPSEAACLFCWLPTVV